MENDKATMEVPSPMSGKVIEVKVSAGDKVSEGSPLILMNESSTGVAHAAPTKEMVSEGAAPAPQANSGEGTYGSTSDLNDIVEVRVPDIGDFKDVEIIEVSVAPGDTINAEARSSPWKATRRPWKSRLRCPAR